VKLHEMRVLVTGASSGLGAHMASMLAAKGTRVAAAARRVAAIDALAGASDGKIVPIEMDVSDPASVECGVDAAAEALGGLDGLVNDAGVAWGGRAIEMPEADWQKVIDTNLSGVFRVAQATARVWRVRAAARSSTRRRSSASAPARGLPPMRRRKRRWCT